MTTVADYNRRSFNHFMPGHRYAGCTFIPRGTFEREKGKDHDPFFTLQAGPGVVDLSADELRGFIAGLQNLLKVSEDYR